MKLSPGVSQYIRSESLQLPVYADSVPPRSGAFAALQHLPWRSESVLLSILYAADRAACQLALLVSALLFAAFLALFMVVRPFVLKATSLFIQSVSDIRRL